MTGDIDRLIPWPCALYCALTACMLGSPVRAMLCGVPWWGIRHSLSSWMVVLTEIPRTRKTIRMQSVRVRRNCFPFRNGSDPVLGVVRLFIFAVGSHRWLKPNWSWWVKVMLLTFLLAAADSHSDHESTRHDRSGLGNGLTDIHIILTLSI